MTDTVAYGLPVSQLDPIAQQLFTGGQAHAPFLGPLPQLSTVDSYEGTNKQFFSYPESKKGQSQHLGDTVLDVLFTVDNTFISRDILPLYPTDQVSFSWTQFVLNAHMLELNPYTTRAHAVTQKRNIRRASLVRRGIEAEFEADFLKSALGRVSFLGALRQISNALKNTIHYDGIRSIMNCHRQQNQFLKKATVPPEREFINYLYTDINRFATVQKEKNGLVKLHAEINSEMQARGGEADAYLIPESIAIYQGLVRDEVTDFYLAGQMGPDRINGLAPYTGPAAGNTQGTLRRIEPTMLLVDSSVYIVKDMVIQGLKPSDTQAMSRVRQIGEYFKMIDDCQDPNNYNTKNRSILVYNEDIDDMTEIGLEEVINHAGIWDDKTGKIRPVGISDYDSEMSKRDHDEDFMTAILPNNGRGSIEVIGQIDPVFLPTKCIINAGKVMNNVFGAKLKTDFIKKDAATSVYTIAKDKLSAALNLLNIKSDEKVVIEKVYDLKAVVSTGLPKDVAPVKSKLEPIFYKALIGGAPASKRDEINSIINDDNLNRLTKAEKIKTKIIEYTNSKVEGCIFKNDKEVGDWHKDILNRYDEVNAKNLQEQSQQTKTGETKIYGYVKTGTDLSGTGLEYLENKSSGYASIGMMDKSYVDDRRKRPEDNTYMNTVNLHMQAIDTAAESDEVKFAAKLWLLIPFTKSSLASLAQNNIPVPFNILIFRPHMQYMTQAIAKCKKGGGTGITPIGTTDMRIAHTVGTKMANMHFTTHTRSVITQPQNAYIVPDVHCQEYLGGGGCRFWTPDAYRKKDFNHLEASLIAVFVPLTETIFSKYMDVSGRFYTEYTMAPNHDDLLHYSTAARYNYYYNFRGGVTQGMEQPTMTLNRLHNNRIVCEGHHQLWNHKKEEHSRIVVGKGHWGTDVYAGCGAVRNGKLTQLRPQNYSTRNSN